MNPDLKNTKIREELKLLSLVVDKAVSNFNDMQQPLSDTNENLPKIAEQLKKINQQTEAASMKLLDNIEQIQARDIRNQKAVDEIIKKAESKSYRNVISIAKKLKDDVAQNAIDITALTNAMQFQDITAQQTSHVVGLLDDLKKMLNRILAIVKGETDPIEEESNKNLSYDPSVDMNEGHTSQNEIDLLFSGQNKDE